MSTASARCGWTSWTGDRVLTTVYNVHLERCGHRGRLLRLIHGFQSQKRVHRRDDEDCITGLEHNMSVGIDIDPKRILLHDDVDALISRAVPHT